jgi:hypothetical protein
MNGERVRTSRDRRTARIEMAGYGSGVATVRAKLELANGRAVSLVRRYVTCVPQHAARQVR